MIDLAPDRTLGEIVNASPTSARVLESFGLDYCCGGQRRLDDACSDAGMGPASAVAALTKLGPDPQPDWGIDGSCRVGRPFRSYPPCLSPHRFGASRRARRRGRCGPTVIGRSTMDARATREFYDGLADLEADTHLHVHKEHNVLFPAVVALEQPSPERDR